MKLPKTFSGEGDNIFVIIETPKGSRNKYKFDEETRLIEISKILPAGTSFPLDFGFIPQTRGEDGDPLDVLVIMDTPSFPGCLVECRAIGIIEAEQKEKKKKKERNDRILAVAVKSQDCGDIKNIKHLNGHLLDELIHFFQYYNSMCGKDFKFLGTKGQSKALHNIRKSILKK